MADDSSFRSFGAYLLLLTDYLVFIAETVILCLPWMTPKGSRVIIISLNFSFPPTVPRRLASNWLCVYYCTARCSRIKSSKYLLGYMILSLKRVEFGSVLVIFSIKFLRSPINATLLIIWPLYSTSEGLYERHAILKSFVVSCWSCALELQPRHFWSIFIGVCSIVLSLLSALLLNFTVSLN